MVKEEKDEKETYKGDPKLLLEALSGAPGKNGPCPLNKSEAAFYVWNFAVANPSKAAACHDAISLLIPQLKNPDASDEMSHNVAGALAYLVGLATWTILAVINCYFYCRVALTPGGVRWLHGPYWDHTACVSTGILTAT
jgi:hypothetical protein